MYNVILIHDSSYFSNHVYQAYDSHCNLVLGDVEETIYVTDEDDEEEEPRVRPIKKQSEMLFVRGGSTHPNSMRLF